MTGRIARLYRGETNVDFIGKRRIWFTVSAILITISIGALLVKELNFGIEFEGGVSIRAEVPADGSLGDASDLEVIQEIRESLAEFGADDAVVQVATQEGERSVIVQTKEVADPEVQAQVVSAVADTVGIDPSETDSQRIGSKWGGEITRKAIRALIIFLLVVFLFMAWRFEWKMGAAALVALGHDLTITAGIYALVGFEVTPSTVIALLTILGYSLYDTVVVFDKVEEDAKLFAASGKMTYQDAANLALNQVFMRSLNTSLSTLLPVTALLVVGSGLLGAQTMKDLSLALLVGIGVSSYSSVFVAVPVLSLWKENEPKFRNVRERVLREAARKSGVTAVREEEDLVPVASASASQASTAARPPARARVGTKKSKRRKRK